MLEFLSDKEDERGGGDVEDIGGGIGDMKEGSGNNGSTSNNGITGNSGGGDDDNVGNKNDRNNGNINNSDNNSDNASSGNGIQSIGSDCGSNANISTELEGEISLAAQHSMTSRCGNESSATT